MQFSSEGRRKDEPQGRLITINPVKAAPPQRRNEFSEAATPPKKDAGGQVLRIATEEEENIRIKRDAQRLNELREQYVPPPLRIDDTPKTEGVLETFPVEPEPGEEQKKQTKNDKVVSELETMLGNVERLKKERAASDREKGLEAKIRKAVEAAEKVTAPEEVGRPEETASPLLKQFRWELDTLNKEMERRSGWWQVLGRAMLRGKIALLQEKISYEEKKEALRAEVAASRKEKDSKSTVRVSEVEPPPVIREAAPIESIQTIPNPGDVLVTLPDKNNPKRRERAVESKENAPKKISITFKGEGGIKGILNLKTRIKRLYPDLSKAPTYAQDFMSSDAREMATKLGFYDPNSENESARIYKGSTLGFDEKGNLIFRDIQTGKDVTKFEGEMYHSEV